MSQRPQLEGLPLDDSGFHVPNTTVDPAPGSWTGRTRQCSSRNDADRATVPLADEGLLDPDEVELISDDKGALAAGTLVGSYRILDFISEGGMGDVYLVEHVHLGRRFAMKRLHEHFAQDTKFVRRFFAEARQLSQICHRNIVEVTDFVSSSNHRCLVMELLKGQTLADMLKEQGALPLEDALDIGGQLADAVAAVHAAGIMHRDLKPENVMLLPDDEGTTVKLIDFGIAKVVNSHAADFVGLTVPGMSLGTPGYMAPEQILEGTCDRRADIYAFGVLMYMMVTGKPPFSGNDFHAVMLAHATESPKSPAEISFQPIPADLDELIMQCLERDPEKRAQSMDDVNERLVGSVVSRRDRPRPPHRRPRWPWVMAATAAAIAAGAPTGLLDVSARFATLLAAPETATERVTSAVVLGFPGQGTQTASREQEAGDQGAEAAVPKKPVGEEALASPSSVRGHRHKRDDPSEPATSGDAADVGGTRAVESGEERAPSDRDGKSTSSTGPSRTPKKARPTTETLNSVFDQFDN